MVFPDLRTLPLLVDVPADALPPALAPAAGPFCLPVLLLLPVPFIDGIPSSSKAAATSAGLGLPPPLIQAFGPFFALGCLLLILPPAAPALALGDVATPVPAMRFLRAARAASAAVVGVVVVVVVAVPLPTLSADEEGCCCWRIALRFLREDAAAAVEEAEAEAATVVVKFIFKLLLNTKGIGANSNRLCFLACCTQSESTGLVELSVPDVTRDVLFFLCPLARRRLGSSSYGILRS